MQCTTYCKKRFKKVNGVSLPSGLGNGGQWYTDNNFEHPFYKSQSLQTGGVAYFSGGSAGYGHVIFIEKAYRDGSFDYTESNCGWPGHGDYEPSDIMHADSIYDYTENQHSSNSYSDNFVYEGCIYYRSKENPNTGN